MFMEDAGGLWASLYFLGAILIGLYVTNLLGVSPSKGPKFGSNVMIGKPIGRRIKDFR